MDSKKPDQNSNQPAPNNGGIMDIQPPKASNSNASTDETSTEFKPENLSDVDNNDAGSLPDASEIAEPTGAPVVTESDSTDTPSDEGSGTADTSDNADTTSDAEAVVPAPAEDAATEQADATDTADGAAPSSTPLAIDNKAPAAPAAKAGLPKTVVIIAIVVFLLLGGLCVMAFMKTMHGDHSTSNADTTKTASTSPATASDVDNTNKDVDKNLSSIDENKDFPNNEMSDASLGL
jgi:hypothetical protein